MNKHYMKSALVTLLLGVSFALYSQPANVAINAAGATSAKPAILDLSDASNANLGFLMPNVSLLSTTDVATIVGAATGLIVWNTNATMVGGLGVGFYYWSGSHWLYIMNSGAGGVITGAGTANYMARWTSATALGTGVTQDNGTGVSISSSALTPVNLLGVNGNAAFGTYAGIAAAPANGIIVSGQVGIGTSTPNASAALDITSSTQGLLPPRIANPNTITSPATGLIVENSTTGCLEVYNGSAWQNISCPCTIATPGTITGSASPTINTSGTYSIASVPGATSYFWSVSTSNGVVTGGQGTTSATITFSNTAGAMNICVYAITGFCNSATSCMSVTSMTCPHSTVPFTYTGSIVSYTLPTCVTQITITAAGAQGGASGYSAGGLGAIMTGTFTVVGGTSLIILVGGQGGAGSNHGGGGGGSFVTTSTYSPLCIAGGGGGAYYSSDNYDATTVMPASTSMLGNPGIYGSGSAIGGVGGTAGGGGGCAPQYTFDEGQGGAGLTGNGCNNQTVDVNTPTVPQSLTNGGAGGVSCYTAYAGNGGFGGGGAGDWCNWTGGGGGGGYSGGGGGTYYGCGGGGGSYNGGTSQTNTVTNTGNGYITIQY